MIHGPAVATTGSRGAEAPAASLRADYEGLRAIGLSDSEAGNLSAHLAGLGHSRQGWRFPEVLRLLFLRSLVESGRLRS